MKTNKMLTGFMAIALLALPALSLANTYQFIDTSGNLRSMEADSFAEALATAPQLAVHSGVMLVREGGSSFSTPTITTTVSGSITTSGTGNYYQYIDTSGNLRGVWAANSSEALATAPQLAVHSGVVFVK